MERKHALLIFSKPPEPGRVKTRLLQENGGPLTPEQATEFFRRSLYDVCEMGMHALIELQWENDAEVEANPEADRHVYDFFVSTTPAASLPAMRETFDAIGPWPMEIHYLVDKGATFDDHFDDAIKQLFDMGYESIAAIAGDVPIMPKNHLKQSFQWLNYFEDMGTPGFVVAPCQECGTSLIAQSRNTPINNQGVYYNLDGVPALDAYVEKIREENIPCVFLDPVADVDNGEDLAHAISCLRAIKIASKYQPDLYVAQRVLDWMNIMGFTVSTPPNDEHDPRQYIDDVEEAQVEEAQ